ncbi:hypothetical protein Anapl_00154 [Anas platyrhynchos]|uniref:Uncharacterized protein n=1 Tax=Anas platyrhynchos TaxID=8839 RepID=R0LR21_ANAPL|nr:hypothetical protein Anapl_00154 [Anas platyrhynchos]
MCEFQPPVSLTTAHWWIFCWIDAVLRAGENYDISYTTAFEVTVQKVLLEKEDIPLGSLHWSLSDTTCFDPKLHVALVKFKQFISHQLPHWVTVRNCVPLSVQEDWRGERGTKNQLVAGNQFRQITAAAWGSKPVLLPPVYLRDTFRVSSCCCQCFTEPAEMGCSEAAQKELWGTGRRGPYLPVDTSRIHSCVSTTHSNSSQAAKLLFFACFATGQAVKFRDAIALWNLLLWGVDSLHAGCLNIAPREICIRMICKRVLEQAKCPKYLSGLRNPLKLCAIG